MNRFRIVVNRLPEDVLREILHIGDGADGDSRWTAIRCGKTRRVYRFTPSENDPSWLVKWGYRCFSSWKKIRNILSGNDDATVEWQKTTRAGECGIPVLEFDLVAAPNLLAGSFETLLVNRFLGHSRDAARFVFQNAGNPALIESFLRNLGILIGTMHRKGLLHRDLSFDNLLVSDSAGEEILVVDWFKSCQVSECEDRLYRGDLKDPLSDMVRAGLRESQIRVFLNAYAEQVDWCAGRLDDLLQVGRENRISLCKRVYRNCTRESHQVVRYRHGGYRVFQLKRADPERIRRQIDLQSNAEDVLIFDEKGSGESQAERWWRTANVLEMAGVSSQGIEAYVIRRRLFRGQEILCFHREADPIPVHFFFNPQSAIHDPQSAIRNPQFTRRDLLSKAGDFLHRLHVLGIGIRNADLSRWFCRPVAGGNLLFETSDLDAFILFECKSYEDRFGWMAGLDKHNLTTRDLIAFLRGYGNGTVDRALLRQILGFLHELPRESGRLP